MSKKTEQDELVLCEECQKNDSKSKVYPNPFKQRTSSFPPYYDEEGVYHAGHSTTIVTTRYKCSSGHEWNVDYKIEDHAFED